MKYRGGFVSNSSSSSFIIAVKNGDVVDEKKLIELFQVPETSPIYDVVSKMASVMWNRAKLMDEKEILYRTCCKTIDEAVDGGYREAKLHKAGYMVYQGWASDEDGGIEALICNTSIDYESPDLILQSDGGY